ncbi:MAG: response regulator [Methylococcaceae bacterium]|nr:MAG: response regulator [Methylococcaceae bacterium]
MTDTSDIRTLLITDDSRVARLMIRAFVLAKHHDWVIIEADSGNAALESVEKDHPHYCTMDINMPGINGTEAARQILEKYPAIKMVLFSANIQESNKSRAAQLGAKFVAKPVTENSVAQALAFFEGPG